MYEYKYITIGTIKYYLRGIQYRAILHAYFRFAIYYDLEFPVLDIIISTYLIKTPPTLCQFVMNIKS